MWRNRTYETNLPPQAQRGTSRTTCLRQHVGQSCGHREIHPGKGTGRKSRDKFPGGRGLPNKSETRDEVGRNYPKGPYDTRGDTREGGAAKQREEDIHLDWAEEVTTHEDQAEEMDLSTDNLSEKERAGRPDMTQETGAHKKPTAPDEGSDDDNGQGESQTSWGRISRINEQTETAKNRVLCNKKIKLEPGRDQKTARKSQKIKYELT